MSSKFIPIFVFSVIVASVKAQETNHLCPCDTEQDQTDNKDLWTLLKKLSTDVSKENEELYAVPPGNLFQFDCSRCDDNLRRKRRIMLKDEPDVPEEVANAEEKKREEDDEVRGKRNVLNKLHDSRCPKDTVKVAGICVSVDNIEVYDDDE